RLRGAAAPGGAVDVVRRAVATLGRRKLAADARGGVGRAWATFAEPVQIAAGETLMVTSMSAASRARPPRSGGPGGGDWAAAPRSVSC
ncbi:MAG: hypothetical protein QM328_09500, partial [Acidobacteriota bacterium]|nr:hypothetical protein [Acidobacteriota bacterium]